MNAPGRNFILVVDDRPANRYTVVHALKRAGYDVLEAATGTAALKIAKQIPAVILLDVKLPDILGYEVCRRLKSNPRTSHIPVLQLSAAFADNESRVYALESGADAYLTQPVEPNVLVATVKSLVKMHEAESLAKLSSRQWQDTFDALSEGVAVISESGHVERCNRAMVALLDLSYSEIEGKSLGDLIGGTLRSLLPSDDVRSFEFSWETRSFRGRLEPIFLDGVKNGGIFVLSDITRQKMAEHAALTNERLAATGRMAHTIAHEINNPLEALTNLLYLMESPETNAEAARQYLTAAQDEVARVSRISRQILTFHRESATPVWVTLADLLDDVLALNNRAIVDKRLTVRKAFNTECRICGFPAQLRQVFSNIVRNAIDASDKDGRLRIRISPAVCCRLVEEPAVRITIADEGCGIPRENLEKVFDAFFTTKELKGTGVGLWLSSSIVHEHRGRIQVRSSTSPGSSGTLISVLLPVNRSVMPEDRPA